tara:strand:+ start:136 stop:423 length:288 start_codon:yes stop_codon:yes gene_type:complete
MPGMRGKTRYTKYLKTFEGKQCGCNEAESHRLCYWPHDSTIRSLYIRWGPDNPHRKKAEKLMQESIVVCANCQRDGYHAIKTNEELPFIFALTEV